MIHHPLGNSGDFDIENIVDAQPVGEADWDDIYEAGGDFGLHGQEYDYSMSGRKKLKKKLKKAVKKVSPKAIVQAVKEAPKAIAQATGITKVAEKVVPPSVQTVLTSVENKISEPVKNLIAQQKFGASTSNSMTVQQPAPQPAVVMMAPSQNQGTVVSTGGQLSQQKLERSMPRMASATVHHPLLSYGTVSAMGYVQHGMGLSFSELLASAKAKAEEELRKLKEKAAADLKARTSEALSNVSGKLISDPKVQSVIQEQAKNAAIQTSASKIAETLRDPTFQKRAAIGIPVAIGVIGYLTYRAFSK